jgi:hypothetical protein
MAALSTFLEGGGKAMERKPLLSALGRNGAKRLHKLDAVKGSSANGRA